MRALDWIIIAAALLLVFGLGIYTQSFMKSVADFLSARRMAGRYLLAVSRGEQQAGAVMFVAMFEMIGKSGFTTAWWQWVGVPVTLLVALSGFVIYRYRETRAMTLAQFFELRYSKSFRVFTGILGFGAGVVNFGVIPAIGARCMIYFLGLPPTITFGGWTIESYIPLMGLFLGITLALTLSGGLITLMVTNCVEGMLSQVFYLIIIAALLMIFSWSEISSVLGHRPPGQSLLNPFDAKDIPDFNLWFVLMTLIVSVYGTMAWQNTGSYNSASATPHESVMGGILTVWRESGKLAVITLLAICAVTFLQHPNFAAAAAPVTQRVAEIANPKNQEQMKIPIAVATLLPVGVRGILCAILIMGIFGGDGSHLLSWGSIFVQDVLVPLRRRPFTTKQHIWALRASITGVALFAFFFGALFKQTEYVFMWWAVTMAIFVGGAGAAIIGGLYWKKATTAAAWMALFTGSGLSVGGIVVRQIYGDGFPLNGTQISFFATFIAIAVFIAASLLTCKEDFNMDRLLHRGIYAPPGKVETPGWDWKQALMMGPTFPRGDRWIAGSLFWWSIFWFVVFMVVTAWNFIRPWPTEAWSIYWHIAGVGVPIFIAAVTGVWFTWGGLRDMRVLFQRLRSQRVNHLDDGTVIDHQNLDELSAPSAEPRN